MFSISWDEETKLSNDELRALEVEGQKRSNLFVEAVTEAAQDRYLFSKQVKNASWHVHLFQIRNHMQTENGGDEGFARRVLEVIRYYLEEEDFFFSSQGYNLDTNTKFNIVEGCWS